MKYVLLFLSLNVFAQENWLCVEDSSQIQGASILACGVGVGPNEAQARTQARKSAEEEFNLVCGENTDCGDRKFSASPSRATCQESDGIWKCYRLIVYRVSENKREHNSNIIEAHNRNMMDEALKNGMGRGW